MRIKVIKQNYLEEGNRDVSSLIKDERVRVYQVLSQSVKKIFIFGEDYILKDRDPLFDDVNYDKDSIEEAIESRHQSIEVFEDLRILCEDGTVLRYWSEGYFNDMLIYRITNYCHHNDQDLLPKEILARFNGAEFNAEMVKSLFENGIISNHYEGEKLHRIPGAPILKAYLCPEYEDEHDLDNYNPIRGEFFELNLSDLQEDHGVTCDLGSYNSNLSAPISLKDRGSNVSAVEYHLSDNDDILDQTKIMEEYIRDNEEDKIEVSVSDARDDVLETSEGDQDVYFGDLVERAVDIYLDLGCVVCDSNRTSSIRYSYNSNVPDLLSVTSSLLSRDSLQDGLLQEAEPLRGEIGTNIDLTDDNSFRRLPHLSPFSSSTRAREFTYTEVTDSKKQKAFKKADNYTPIKRYFSEDLIEVSETEELSYSDENDDNNDLALTDYHSATAAWCVYGAEIAGADSNIMGQGAEYNPEDI